MIDYIEKGPGLHAAIRAAGHWLREENGVLVSSNDVAVQAIIDSYDPLPEAKAAKWLEIFAERERRKNGGYVTQGKRFHSDADSRIQQLGLLMMGQNMPPGIQWRTLDSGFVTMTPALAAAIFNSAASADMQLFAAAEAHRAAVNALTDLVAIAAYDFSGGWPEV